MSRDYYRTQNQGPRDEQDARQDAGYREGSPHQAWEGSRTDYRGPWRRDEQRAGFYEPSNEQREPSYRSTSYRESPYQQPQRDRDRELEAHDAWIRRSYQQQGNPRFGENAGYTGQAERSDDPGYRTARDLAYRFHEQPRFGRERSDQPDYSNYNPYAEYGQFSTQQPYGARSRTGNFAADLQQRRERSQFGRGPRGYKRSDERIREEVNERLYRDHDLDASEIDVRVSEGQVTLDGSVQSRYFKRLAEDLAIDVLGVEDVINHLRAKREGDEVTVSPTSTAESSSQRRNGPTSATRS